MQKKIKKNYYFLINEVKYNNNEKSNNILKRIRKQVTNTLTLRHCEHGLFILKIDTIQ